jgi:ribosomal RNA-processing protein 9
VEESQLIFRGGGSGEIAKDLAEGLLLPSELGDAKKMAKKDGGIQFGGSIDVVAMLDEEYFVSGTDNGAISLWNIGRKKPLYTRIKAHGGDGTKSNDDMEIDKSPASVDCNWIISLTVVRYSDMFASGSCDGFVRLWKLQENKRAFSLLTSIPMVRYFQIVKS